MARFTGPVVNPWVPWNPWFGRGWRGSLRRAYAGSGAQGAVDAPDPPHLRRLACCASEPPCVLCPLSPQNERLSLRELAALGLKANVDAALAE